MVNGCNMNQWGPVNKNSMCVSVIVSPVNPFPIDKF